MYSPPHHLKCTMTLLGTEQHPLDRDSTITSCHITPLNPAAGQLTFRGGWRHTQMHTEIWVIKAENPPERWTFAQGGVAVSGVRPTCGSQLWLFPNGEPLGGLPVSSSDE